MSLTPNELLANGGIPANSFIVQNNKVFLDVSVFIGETVANLDNACLAEVGLKLHNACFAAQNKKNESLASGLKINSWSAAISGSSVYYSSYTPPGYYQTWTLTQNFLVKTDVNEVLPVLQ